MIITINQITDIKERRANCDKESWKREIKTFRDKLTDMEDREIGSNMRIVGILEVATQQINKMKPNV